MDDGIDLYFRDVTERKSAEETLTRKAEELEHFAYMSSHDLQEPLRKIINFGDLLKTRYFEKLDENGVKYIDVIMNGAKRLQMLIRDLLAFSRVPQAQDDLEPVDLNKIVSLVLNDLETRIKESNAMICVDKLPAIKANASQMSQLFINLVGNALKYQTGGKPAVHIEARKQDKTWLLAVRDNGIGIDAKYHQKIFEPFQRLHAKNEFAGSGVGLATCKKIIERLGGKIWVESEAGKGSAFYFTLPG